MQDDDPQSFCGEAVPWGAESGEFHVGIQSCVEAVVTDDMMNTPGKPAEDFHDGLKTGADILFRAFDQVAKLKNRCDAGCFPEPDTGEKVPGSGAPAGGVSCAEMDIGDDPYPYRSGVFDGAAGYGQEIMQTLKDRFP